VKGGEFHDQMSDYQYLRTDSALFVDICNCPSVLQDGDFLVRESQGSPGQYVLTGMQGGLKKHLLLVDPEGVVSILTPSFMKYMKLTHNGAVVHVYPHFFKSETPEQTSVSSLKICYIA
jgi:hypothetical protein